MANTKTNFEYKGYTVYSTVAKNALNAASHNELNAAVTVAEMAKTEGYAVDYLESRDILDYGDNYTFFAHTYVNGDEAFVYGFGDEGVRYYYV